MTLGPQHVRQALGRVCSGVRVPTKNAGRFGFFGRTCEKEDDRDMADYVAGLTAKQVCATTKVSSKEPLSIGCDLAVISNVRRNWTT
jgi:hypothetical protein